MARVLISTICFGLFFLVAGALGYTAAVAEYCWYPSELQGCTNYQPAAVLTNAADWLVKPAVALAMITFAMWCLRHRWRKQPRDRRSYSHSGNQKKVPTRLKEQSSTKRSRAYDEAVQTAALMFLASLRDYINSPFSGPQLEMLRNRVAILRSTNGARRDNINVVFADVRKRAADMLSAELRVANVGDQVAGDVIRVLHDVLASAEDAFLIDKAA